MLRRTGFLAGVFLLMWCGAARAATVTSWTRSTPASPHRPGRRRRRRAVQPYTPYTPQWLGDILSVGPLKLAAPPGQTLAAGVYDPVTPAYDRDGTHAGIDVDGCDPMFDGRFEIRDIAWGDDGLAPPACGWSTSSTATATTRPMASCD